jgi:hypothetical protein
MYSLQNRRSLASDGGRACPPVLRLTYPFRTRRKAGRSGHEVQRRRPESQQERRLPVDDVTCCETGSRVTKDVPVATFNGEVNWGVRSAHALADAVADSGPEERGWRARPPSCRRSARIGEPTSNPSSGTRPRSASRLAEFLPLYLIRRSSRALSTAGKLPYHDVVRVPVVVEFTS